MGYGIVLKCKNCKYKVDIKTRVHGRSNIHVTFLCNECSKPFETTHKGSLLNGIIIRSTLYSYFIKCPKCSSRKVMDLSHAIKYENNSKIINLKCFRCKDGDFRVANEYFWD